MLEGRTPVLVMYELVTRLAEHHEPRLFESGIVRVVHVVHVEASGLLVRLLAEVASHIVQRKHILSEHYPLRSLAELLMFLGGFL